ncbi:MAG: plasmid pRiA4b ORF-3 family protein [Bacillota bacterium]
MSEMTITPQIMVNEMEPSPIVRDFELYTEFLRNDRTALTPKNQYLAKKPLYQINQQMATYVTADNPNFDQTSYPLLNLFYHLVLAGKLFRKIQAKAGRFELQSTERYVIYQSLKLAEKYFFLLETLWIDVDWKDINPVQSRDEAELNIGEFFKIVSQQQPGRVITAKSGKSNLLSSLLNKLGLHMLILSFYGFWRVTRDEEAMGLLYSKYDFRAATLTPSGFGVNLAGILATVRNLPYWNVPNRRENGETEVIPGSPLPRQNRYRQIQETIKSLQAGKKARVNKSEEQVYKEEPFFLPFIAFFDTGELETTLPREQARTGGNYSFKVSLNKKTWRRVVLSAQHTLKDLHFIIQEAFEFDDDHLYCFFMDGKRWSKKAYYSPNDDQGPYVNKVRIWELGLEPGQEILYFFDYGDEWCFKVLLEDKAEEGPKLIKPMITESAGESPHQYPLWEE